MAGVVRVTEAALQRLAARPGVRGMRVGAGSAQGKPQVADLKAPGRRGDSLAQQRLHGEAERFLRACSDSRISGLELVREHVVETVPGQRRGRYRIDVAIPSLLIGLEMDGFAFHARFPSSFLRHTLRQNALVRRGWLLLRYTRGMLERPERICEDLEAALRLRLNIEVIDERRVAG